ncbi:hypothetical protein KC330_g8668 [Hortaea werneckii]|nr:hypothetical protein KC330_g8668 [Hortaea werneckii]
MEAPNSVLEILPQDRVVICTQCQYAIIPSGVKENLRTSHKRLPLQRRQEIIDTVANNRSLAQTPSDVIYPLPTDLPLESLPVYLDGLRCKAGHQPNGAYQYVCRTVRGKQEHCKQNYGWVNTQRSATALPLGENESSYLPRITEAAESKLQKAHSWRFDGDDCEDSFFTAESDEDRLRPDDHVPTQEQLGIWSAACTLAQDGIAADDEQKVDELKSRLLGFWMLLITQDTGSQRYSSNLSAIIWVVQLCIFYDSARKERAGQQRTLGLAKQYCERYLQQTVETPMVENLRWRLLPFRVPKDTVGEHEVFWDESEQVLTYEDTECIGAYLMRETDLLSLCGYTDHGSISPEDLEYNIYQQLAIAGIRGLENYSVEGESWSQAHSQTEAKSHQLGGQHSVDY